ncbi:Polycomb complex protein BMI-1 [Halotydeus destructor]|nr:Polycomb complex protein BMI-1 [Halotydeus destructor]
MLGPDCGPSLAATGHCTRAQLIDVNAWISCLLCGGYLINATTINDCMHSFCRSCITNWLEKEKKTVCPTCESPLHKSKPFQSIRSDETLQDIVYKLVPGLYKRELEKRQEYYKVNPEAAALASAEERGEAEHHKIFYIPEDKISLSLEYGFADNQMPRTAGSGSESTRDKDKDPVRRYLRCSAGMPISLLKDFVVKKYSLPGHYTVNIFYLKTDQSDEYSSLDAAYKYSWLSDEYTLMDVAYKYMWPRSEPMRLFYLISSRPGKLQSRSQVDKKQKSSRPEDDGDRNRKSTPGGDGHQVRGPAEEASRKASVQDHGDRSQRTGSGSGGGHQAKGHSDVTKSPTGDHVEKDITVSSDGHKHQRNSDHRVTKVKSDPEHKVKPLPNQNGDRARKLTIKLDGQPSHQQQGGLVGPDGQPEKRKVSVASGQEVQPKSQPSSTTAQCNSGVKRSRADEGSKNGSSSGTVVLKSNGNNNTSGKVQCNGNSYGGKNCSSGVDKLTAPGNKGLRPAGVSGPAPAAPSTLPVVAVSATASGHSLKDGPCKGSKPVRQLEPSTVPLNNVLPACKGKDHKDKVAPCSDATRMGMCKVSTQQQQHQNQVNPLRIARFSSDRKFTTVANGDKGTPLPPYSEPMLLKIPRKRPLDQDSRGSVYSVSPDQPPPKKANGSDSGVAPSKKSGQERAKELFESVVAEANQCAASQAKVSTKLSDPDHKRHHHHVKKTPKGDNYYKERERERLETAERAREAKLKEKISMDKVLLKLHQNRNAQKNQVGSTMGDHGHHHNHHHHHHSEHHSSSHGGKSSSSSSSSPGHHSSGAMSSGKSTDRIKVDLGARFHSSVTSRGVTIVRDVNRSTMSGGALSITSNGGAASGPGGGGAHGPGNGSAAGALLPLGLGLTSQAVTSTTNSTSALGSQSSPRQQQLVSQPIVSSTCLVTIGSPDSRSNQFVSPPLTPKTSTGCDVDSTSESCAPIKDTLGSGMGLGMGPLDLTMDKPKTTFTPALEYNPYSARH